VTIDELYTALKSLGMPVIYGEFTQPTALPFITYQFAYSGDLYADNINSEEIGNYQVELYTKMKDLPAEISVQNKLKDLNLPYSKIEAWIESEKLRQIIYEIQIIGG